MIAPYKGKFHIEWYPVTVSTTFSYGDMVTILSTVAGVGTLAKVVDGSTRVIGLIQQTIAATDSDYAVARKVPVLVGDADAEFIATAAGTASATDVGEMVGFDDEETIDVTDYTEGQFLITGVISTTQVTGKFNKGFGLEIPITA
jgi:hypothetical protein